MSRRDMMGQDGWLVRRPGGARRRSRPACSSHPAVLPAALALSLPVALSILVGCEPPPRASYMPVTVNVIDTRGRPVLGAMVHVDGAPVGRTGGSGRVIFGRLGLSGQTSKVAVALPPGFQPTEKGDREIEHRLGKAAADGRIEPIAVETTVQVVDARREVLVYAALDCAGLADPSTCSDVEIRAGGESLGRLDAAGELWAVHRVVLNEPVEIEWMPGPTMTQTIETPRARFTPTAGGDVLATRRTPGAVRPASAEVAAPEERRMPPAAAPAAARSRTASSRPPRDRIVRRPSNAPRPGLATRRAGRVALDTRPDRRAVAPTRAAPAIRDTQPIAAGVEAPATSVAPTTPKSTVSVPPPRGLKLNKCISRATRGRAVDARCRARLEGVAATDPIHKQARKALFLGAVNAREWKAVLTHADTLAAIGSLQNDPELHYHRGSALVRLKRYSEAIVSLGRADQLKRYWSSRMRGARTLATLERLAFAHDRLTRAGGSDASHHRRKATDCWKRILILADERGNAAMVKKAEKALARLGAP